MNTQRPPEITVAAIAERHGKFLMIEERVNGALVLNQPAGHLENNETLQDAVVRECLEESGWRFQAAGLCGIYTWSHPRRNVSVIRFAFYGIVTQHLPDAPLDDGIVRALWMTPEEISAQGKRLRTPMVDRAVEDYIFGRRYPLDLLTSIDQPLEVLRSCQGVG